MTIRRRRRRGFAMVVAIVMIGMVAMTLTALGAELYLDSHRTRLLTDQAQLRQLLFAATNVAQARIGDGSAIDAPISVPQDLTEQRAAVNLSLDPRSDDNAKAVHVNASFDGRQMSEVVYIVRQGSEWKIDSAELVG